MRLDRTTPVAQLYVFGMYLRNHLPSPRIGKGAGGN